MSGKDPMAELHTGFSRDDATPTQWAEARGRLEEAELYWLVTVRPDGRPHVTPLLSVWLDEALYFSTGESKRKAQNLARNSHCVLMTGCNALDEGLDLVVEGEARLVSDEARLRRVANGFSSKYVPREGAKPWQFAVREGVFYVDGGMTLLYEVTPTTAFGFGKGEFSQTRWRF
jgi:nitroimidazol reductase NimA-like FMN-containing flavoprotein (pyridoxamine 5'-phosphate oxidase superfamily)